MESPPIHLLREDVPAWNAWRADHQDARPDLRSVVLHRAALSGADLSNANLEGADLRWSDLSGANLESADLSDANLRLADMSEANLEFADLVHANLSRTDLTRANLRSANLSGTLLRKARLVDADLHSAGLASTTFGATQLECRGLGEIRHFGPSFVDLETVRRSPAMPRAFLLGVGWPDDLVQLLPTLLRSTPVYRSCFLSYASQDEDFATQLHRDLTHAGVSCWFAPRDLKVGAHIRDALEENIQQHDKLLVILSKSALESDWVEAEAEAAYERERDERVTMLVPLRVDDAVLESPTPWAANLRRTRNIGDFTHWSDPTAYGAAVTQLLEALRT